MTVNLSIPLPSHEVQDFVLTFFKKNFRPWPDLRQGPDPLFLDEPEGFTTASGVITSKFFKDPTAVGFNYGMLLGSELRYIKTVAAFIALGWGSHKTIGQHTGPYLVYEEEERPLILEGDPSKLPEDLHWQMVDKLGIETMFRRHHKLLKFVYPGDLERIELEMMRLDALANPS